MARTYGELLAGLEQVELPREGPDRVHPWQSYVLAVHPRLDRDAVALALRARGIGCTIGTYASHLQPVYGPQKPLPVSADLFARHLAIPMHANLTGRRSPGLPTPCARSSRCPTCAPDPPRRRPAPAAGGDRTMAENRTVLVTGGAGWIGLRTVPLLLERGYRVRILDSMVRGDRDAVAGWPRAATSSWSTRTCGTAARCTRP